MRALAACLVGFLGFSALATMAACSDSTDTGSAGAGGASTAGAGGKAATAGGSSTAGTGAACAFASDTCQNCLLVDNCNAQVTACGNDAKCGPALQVLPNCVCGTGAKTPDECQAAFVTDGGDVATKLAECYTLNCVDACQ